MNQPDLNPAPTDPPRRSDALVPRGTVAQIEKLLLARLSDTCEKILAVGSYRRGYTQVHDLEFAVVPKLVERIKPGCMFDSETEKVSALWLALEEMVESGIAEKALYPDGFEPDPITGEPIPRKHKTRWGPKQRSLSMALPADGDRPRSLTVEFFSVPARLWGLRVCERTGPAQFSRLMAWRLKKAGYTQKDGQLLKAETGERVDCPTERDLFSLAGLPWIEPTDRSDYWRDH